jgi:3-hydroxyacyl-CoA dehydrogenase
MTNRTIKHIAVLGSGVMGSRIALHLAGAGFNVLLLDRLTPGTENESTATVRNQLVQQALDTAIKSKPSPAYHAGIRQRIQLGNFADDLHRISKCDWIIEVVIERLDVKQALFTNVELHRKPGTLITTNTSGIPIQLIAEGRSDDFKKHFCGTHFFNPPRYLRLLEIIPGPDTDPSVINFLLHFGDLHLGKTTVLCKDTPAFIANRVGVFSIMTIFRLMESLSLSIDDIDTLTGPLIGRPKSATFRTADVVGIDTLVKVAAGVYDHCPHDEARSVFQIPAWLENMVKEQRLGDKTKQGFFKKTVGPDGSKQIKTIQLDTLEYGERRKTSFASVGAAKPLENLDERIKSLFHAQDKAGTFYQQFHTALFAYVANRIPEIADQPYRIDDALKAGFGWEIGAFETWDLLGFDYILTLLEKNGHPLPAWLRTMQSGGFTSFYKTINGQQSCYDPVAGDYQPLPGGQAFLVMKRFENQTIWKNAACRIYHLGDDVLGLEWNTKMGSIGGDVLTSIQKGIQSAEEKYKGLVIANAGNQFSAGANVGLIFMLALEQDFDELDMAVRLFQQTMMRVRYSGIPVVVAPHGLTLGGACELCLHADAVVAAAETYMGLVEVGVGLIPGGGGTKEMVKRAALDIHAGEPETIPLKNRFLHIATAKVATSAHEAFEMGILREGRDLISLNIDRRIALAKQRVLDLYEEGYTQPISAPIQVLGQQGLGAMHAGIHGMWRAGYATDHDATIARKLAYVMCGGDLSQPAAVSEQYLLDLERTAFLQLCGERKTLERIQTVLKTGKPLRN